MALPLLIRIAREEGYRTDTIGRYADGMFFADIHGTDRDAMDEITVLLHLFDHVGRHVRSDIRFGVPHAEADGVRAALLAELADVAFGDIAIRLFAVEAEGIAFGLFDQSDDDRGDWAELLPQWLGFGPPFDGLYST